MFESPLCMAFYSPTRMQRKTLVNLALALVEALILIKFIGADSQSIILSGELFNGEPSSPGGCNGPG